MTQWRTFWMPLTLVALLLSGCGPTDNKDSPVVTTEYEIGVTSVNIVAIETTTDLPVNVRTTLNVDDGWVVEHNE